MTIDAAKSVWNPDFDHQIFEKYKNVELVNRKEELTDFFNLLDETRKVRIRNETMEEFKKTMNRLKEVVELNSQIDFSFKGKMDEFFGKCKTLEEENLTKKSWQKLNIYYSNFYEALEVLLEGLQRLENIRNITERERVRKKTCLES